MKYSLVLVCVVALFTATGCEWGEHRGGHGGYGEQGVYQGHGDRDRDYRYNNPNYQYSPNYQYNPNYQYTPRYQYTPEYPR